MDSILANPDDVYKYNEIRKYLGSDFSKLEELNHVIAKCSGELQLLLKLIKVELLMNYGIGEGVDQLFNEININSYKINDFDNKSVVLIKLKYNDLWTDYQYLIRSLTKNYKFIDLINKKLVLVNNIDDENLKNELFLKITQYLIISNYDFRKVNLFQYVKSLELPLDTITAELLDLNLNQKFIKLSHFKQFLDNCHGIIKYLDYNKLIEFHIENNISILPNYYKSISMTKLETMFTLKLNYERIISEMIINDNLPFGTKINQTNQMVIFPMNNTNNLRKILTSVDTLSNVLV